MNKSQFRGYRSSVPTNSRKVSSVPVPLDMLSWMGGANRSLSLTRKTLIKLGVPILTGRVSMPDSHCGLVEREFHYVMLSHLIASIVKSTLYRDTFLAFYGITVASPQNLDRDELLHVIPEPLVVQSARVMLAAKFRNTVFRRGKSSKIRNIRAVAEAGARRRAAIAAANVYRESVVSSARESGSSSASHVPPEPQPTD